MNRLAKSSHGFQLLQPLDAWSGYRIALTGVVIGLLVFAAGVSLWRSSDLSGTQAVWRRTKRSNAWTGHKQ